MLARVNGHEQRGHVTAIKKDNTINKWYFQIDSGAWWPRSALQKGYGYTNHTEVEPSGTSEDDSETSGKPPPLPPPAWPEEALAVDFLEEEADELLFIDVDQAPGRKEEAKPYFRHTCKSSQEKGAAINIYLEFRHNEAIKSAVESGLGIGCLSEIVLRKNFANGDLVPLKLPKRDMRRTFYFILPRNRQHVDSVEQWMQTCRGME